MSLSTAVAFIGIGYFLHDKMNGPKRIKDCTEPSITKTVKKIICDKLEDICYYKPQNSTYKYTKAFEKDLRWQKRYSRSWKPLWEHPIPYIEFPTRDEAEEALLHVTALINNYGQCSVSDYLGMVDYEELYDYKWSLEHGWRDYSDLKVKRNLNDTWSLDLPEPKQL